MSEQIEPQLTLFTSDIMKIYPGWTHQGIIKKLKSIAVLKDSLAKTGIITAKKSGVWVARGRKSSFDKYFSTKNIRVENPKRIIVTGPHEDGTYTFGSRTDKKNAGEQELNAIFANVIGRKKTENNIRKYATLIYGKLD